MSFLDDLPDIISDALSDDFLAATLTRGTATGDAWNPTPGTPTEYACKVMPDAYSEFYKATGAVKDTESKVIILANSLATEPTPGDRITFRSKTLVIVAVEPDPALATWTCKVSV